ncbi:MAG: TolC family protein, partial [Planctomycetes bacterium]|nr:TolC family protein [Planctomycetota bacterium]
MSMSFGAAGILLPLVLTAVVAAAESPVPSPARTTGQPVSEFIAAALDGDPGLAAAAASTSAADDVVAGAGRWRDPTAQLEGGHVDDGGDSGWRLRAGITQPIPIGGQRSA